MVFNIDEIGDEGLDFKTRKSKEHFGIDQAGCFLNKDVEVSGVLTRLNEEVFLTGRVDTVLSLNCSRCLKQFSHPVQSKLKSHFVPLDNKVTSAGEVELHAADIDTEFYENDRVDLTQSVRDGILLAVPVIFLCREDCNGLCSQCGVNLNQGSCGCAKELPIDPRLEILKTLKEKFK
ncbi:MAG: DUF177 domain-containing protein [Nitrospinaceae bacterium]|jgi:uncharacterized protein|nr:DUF177 domain-containing protein [Nitrospinaceae bacterium]